MHTRLGVELIDPLAHLRVSDDGPAIHRVETIEAGGRTFARCGCGHVWEVLPGGSLACAVEEIHAEFAEDLRRITRERDARLNNRRMLAKLEQMQLRLLAV